MADESLLPDDFEGRARRLVVIILDGWGINEGKGDVYDAIRTASTPTYDWLMKHASSTIVAASGKEIGLRQKLAEQQEPKPSEQQEQTSDKKWTSIYDPGPQPGQTDIGHLHLFSGRLVKQPIILVDELIKGRPIHEGVFDVEREEVGLIVDRMQRVIAHENLRFHHIAFGSEGGVHSCLSHLHALMRLAKSLGMPKDKFVIHFVAEGRDVLVPRSAERFLRDVLEKTEEIGIGIVATVFGRSEWVRKDGYEHVTKRAISALTGELEGFDVRRPGQED
jgi:bisphosphoglycerate-independent phosphoglycerate mutase (AlkP superfamily)